MALDFSGKMVSSVGLNLEIMSFGVDKMVPRRKVPIGEKSRRHFFPQPFKKPAKIRSRSEKSRLSQKNVGGHFSVCFRRSANKPKFSAGKLRQRKFRPQFSPVPKISKNDKLLQELYSGKIEHNFDVKNMLLFFFQRCPGLVGVKRERYLCAMSPLVPII